MTLSSPGKNSLIGKMNYYLPRLNAFMRLIWVNICLGKDVPLMGFKILLLSFINSSKELTLRVRRLCFPCDKHVYKYTGDEIANTEFKNKPSCWEEGKGPELSNTVVYIPTSLHWGSLMVTSDEAACVPAEYPWKLVYVWVCPGCVVHRVNG